MSCLDRVMIAAPCPVSWDSMVGDERVRHCSGCSRNVYNIADMTSTEAETFLEQNGTSHCLRLFRRADGKIMTDNCPRGLRFIRNKCRLAMKLTAGLVASLFAFIPSVRAQSASDPATPSQPSVVTPDIKGDVYIPPKGTGPASNSAPMVTGGKPMMSPPESQVNGTGHETNSLENQRKLIMLEGEGCNKKPPKKSLADSKAYDLFLAAKASESSGKFILALSQYQNALLAARAQTQSDPHFITTVSNALTALRLKMKLPATKSGQSSTKF